MGFLTFVRKIKLKEKEIRILLLGLDNAGKSTVAKCITKKNVEDVEPTLGFIIHTIQFNGYKLNLWDVGGQKSLRPFWRNHFEETDGIIWVLDSTDLERIKEAKTLLHSILKEEKLQTASLLILLNKIDAGAKVDLEWFHKELDLSIITSHKVFIQPCSAIKNVNIIEGLAWIVNEIQNRIYCLPVYLSESTEPL